MSAIDPLVRSLTAQVLEFLWLLDNCGDDEVNPDSAVKMTEIMCWQLQQLPADQFDRIRQAVAMLDEMDGVDFEYEGEMPPELALDPDSRGAYPFMRLTGPANVLIMPAIHSAAISTQLIKSLGGAEVIGPILLGLDRPVQICPLGASVSRILQMATVCAYDRPLVEIAE